VLGSERCSINQSTQPSYISRKETLIPMVTNTQRKNTELEPSVRDLPVGISMTGKRKESDSLGQVEVPADHYWGARTQRSLIHFSIGDDHMPKEVYHAYGYVKKAAALVNASTGRLPQWKADPIARVADEVISHPKIMDKVKAIRRTHRCV
jgi:fumarate hydratase, class II